MPSWVVVDFKNQLYDEIWSRFAARFQFTLGVWDGDDSKALVYPKPYITYDISRLFDSPEMNGYVEDLHRKAQEVFKLCTAKEEYLLALDWEHLAYLVYPHRQFDFGDLNWPISVYPDGDYHFFVAADFSWGCLGHPWAQTITVFGQPLLAHFAERQPLIFDRIVRAES